MANEWDIEMVKKNFQLYVGNVLNTYENCNESPFSWRMANKI